MKIPQHISTIHITHNCVGFTTERQSLSSSAFSRIIYFWHSVPCFFLVTIIINIVSPLNNVYIMTENFNLKLSTTKLVSFNNTTQFHKFQHKTTWAVKIRRWTASLFSIYTKTTLNHLIFIMSKLDFYGTFKKARHNKLKYTVFRKNFQYI